MKRVYEYCFYRCAAFYKKYEGGNYVFSGLLFYFWGLISNYCTLQALFFYLLGIEYNDSFFWGIPAIVGCLIAWVLSDKYEKDNTFDKLEKQYKNSPHWVLRGWLVFLRVVLSFILYGISLYIFFK